MKKIILILVTLFIVSCSNKADEKNTIGIDDNFYLELLKYQKAYPIPNDKWIENKYGTLSKPIYIYKVLFTLSESDTLIAVTRFSDGIYKSENYYGIYSDDKLEATVVSNSKYINKNLFKKNPKDDVLNKYINNPKFSYPESFPPTYVYEMAGNKVNLIKIDTVWSQWD